MILNDKDSTTRIENVRYLRQKKDPPHAAILNRPLRDTEERTNDVWDIMDPAKQFYVHESTPAAFSVDVEPGWVFNEQNFGTVSDPVYFAGDTINVTAADPSKIRIDLIYYNRATNTVHRVTGTEVQESTGWSGLFDEPTPLRAVLPSGHSDLVPLAYLYVGSRTTETFQDATLITAAGHIRDCRLGANIIWNMTGESPLLKADTPGGSAGTSQRVARSNHRHPTNVPTSGVTGSAAKVSQLYAGNSRAAGVQDTYARSNHIHDVDVSGVAGDLLVDRSDVVQGAVGSKSSLARSDHQHPLKIKDVSDPSSMPADLSTALGADKGTGTWYSRFDHRHWISGDVFMSVQAKELKWYQWSAVYGRWAGESISKSTGAFSLRPLFAITLCCGKVYSAAAGWTSWQDGAGYQSWGWVFEGNPPPSQYSIGVQDYWNRGDDTWTCSRENGTAAHTSVPFQGYSTTAERELNCTYLGQLGASYSISSGSWHGYLSTIAFGFIDVSP